MVGRSGLRISRAGGSTGAGGATISADFGDLDIVASAILVAAAAMIPPRIIQGGCRISVRRETEGRLGREGC